MKTAFVYIMTSLTLGIILAVARSKGHEVSKGIDVFRYQPGLLWVLFGCSFIPILAAFFIYQVAVPRPDGSAQIVLFSIGFLMSVGVMAAYAHLRSVRYEIGDNFIAFVKKRGSLKVRCEDIGRVKYSTAGRDSGSIRIYATDGKQLMYVPGTFQDLDVMASLLRARSMKYGFSYVDG
ncbi:hypothetical protein [Burkholderia sp. MSHR3999]|uniref:hypothetical protein n=1 Tax=Burkholderia sp. MSHR3999 TaxID=1542965 RepID=UPI0012E0A44E|nr:hypothetical protein [Burkholderia sp. MSHR3999]